MKKLSEIQTTPTINSGDTILVLDTSGKTRRIYVGDLVRRVYDDDTFRNNLVESLTDTDYFHNATKSMVIALLEELGSMPEGATQAFINFLTAAADADNSGPLIPTSDVTIGPNVTIIIDDPEG